MSKSIETVIESLERGKKQTILSLWFGLAAFTVLITLIIFASQQYDVVMSNTKEQIQTIRDEFDSKMIKLQAQIAIARGESQIIQELLDDLRPQVDANSQRQRNLIYAENMLSGSDHGKINKVETLEEDPNISNTEYKAFEFIIEGTQELTRSPESALDSFRAAIVAYENAPEMDEAQSTAYWGAAKASLKLQEANNALDDINLAIKKTKSESKKSQLYSERGLIYLRLEEIILAINDQDTAIDLDRSKSTPYRRRGLLYMKIGEVEKARKDFNFSSDLAIGLKSVASALENIGLLELHLGNWNAALNHANYVNEIDSGLSWNWTVRMLAAKNLDEKEIFESSLTKLLELQEIEKDNSIWFYLTDELTKQLTSSIGRDKF